MRDQPRPGHIRIGCSSWEYKHWRGDFYPTEVPRTRWFDYPDERLGRWADWIREQMTGNVDVYAYFNNDVGGTRRATR